MKKQMKTILPFLVLATIIEKAGATEFESLGKAVAGALGTTKAFKKTVAVDGKSIDIFYAKGGDGKAVKYAIVQKGIYEPNCTHTWVVGVDAASSKVSQVRVVEMSCPHAFPTKASNFLDQYKGKGPADVATLKEKVLSIAKATGSADLTTDAVKRSIVAASKVKGTL